MSRTQDELSRRAHRLIPGGAHTYSKGDDQFPANAPRLISRGAGGQVWDPDGNQYLDWGMGLRAVVLGHAYPRVVEAAREQLGLGSNFTRPSPLEGDLAECLVELLPGLDMVKFAKNGSDVTTAAVRLVRAFTGRDLVAICRDNPFYSFDDWFIGLTACNAGIPDATTRMTLAFDYGDIGGLEKLFAEHPGQIGCVMVEPAAMAPPVATAGCARCHSRRCATSGPAPRDDCRNGAFLRAVVDVAHRHGALVVFDEMITGFRWDVPGALSLYDVMPDLATFGKAVANGFSVAALAGRREIMDQGGIHQTERPKVFLLSATSGGETHALAAALATVREMREQPVIPHIWKHGEALQRGLNAVSAELGLADLIGCEGYPCSPALRFLGRDRRPSAALRTLFLQEMVREGILMPYLTPSYAHTMADVERTVEAAGRAFRRCRQALETGFDGLLEGPPVQPVFRRHNSDG